jgi:hypothetical protein
MYSPQSNAFRELTAQTQIDEATKNMPQLLFQRGEEVTIKGVVFTVHDIGDRRLVLKPKRAA